MHTFTVKATKGIVASDVYMKPEREKLMMEATNQRKLTFQILTNRQSAQHYCQ